MMKTRTHPEYMTPLRHAERAIAARPADILAHGGLVAIPTETVYGLAADAYDEAAVEAVLRRQGPPQR